VRLKGTANGFRDIIGALTMVQTVVKHSRPVYQVNEAAIAFNSALRARNVVFALISQGQLALCHYKA
jgi:hypothetical protein